MKKYKIKGLADEHPANKEFDKFMKAKNLTEEPDLTAKPYTDEALFKKSKKENAKKSSI